MTQKIKSWKEKVSIFFQNCAKKELETEKETAKQSIIHILIKDKTTQELCSCAKKQLHYELKHTADPLNQQALALAYLALCRIPKEEYIL